MTESHKLLIYRIFLATGFLFSLFLIVHDIMVPGYCPQLFVFPACYAVFFYFLIPFLLSFVETRAEKPVSAVILALGIITALYFSIRFVFKTEFCPTLFSIPLCFGSLALFTALLFLRLSIGIIKTKY